MICAASERRAWAIRFHANWEWRQVSLDPAQAAPSSGAWMAHAFGCLITVSVRSICPASIRIMRLRQNHSMLPRSKYLRGPATLLYGSGASGGVVNVVSRRIPDQRFTSPKGDVEIRGNTATEERSGALNASGSIGNVSLSGGGFRRKTGDYHIPGFADENNPSGKKGVVENSSVNSGGGYLGGSFVGEKGFMGLSVAQFDSKYGIPSPEGSR